MDCLVSNKPFSLDREEHIESVEDKYYTPQEISVMLKVAYMTVYRWIRAGKLEAYQVHK